MNFFIDLYRYLTVFSLNFSSVGKGSFAAGKATLNFSSIGKASFAAGKGKKCAPQRCTFLGEGGQWSAGHGSALAGKFGSYKFSETSFPHFKTFYATPLAK